MVEKRVLSERGPALRRARGSARDYFGACNSGELAHPSISKAVSACLTFLRTFSRSGPSGVSAAFRRASAVNAAIRS